MALLHAATIKPTKLELLTPWVAHQPWREDLGGSTEVVGSFRFDDPDGEVGVETFLLGAGAGSPVLHVPVTYRAAPLPGAEAHLVGTMEHSVLGTRWVYDGCADPVFVATVVAAIVTGVGQAADLIRDDAGRLRARPPTARVRGLGWDGHDVVADGFGSPVHEGTVDVVRSAGLALRVHRVVRLDEDGDGPRLVGTWDAQTDPALLATLEQSGQRVR